MHSLHRASCPHHRVDSSLGRCHQQQPSVHRQLSGCSRNVQAASRTRAGASKDGASINGRSAASEEEMLVLQPKTKPSGPLQRSSFRQRKRSGEERRAEREAEAAEMAAYRKRRNERPPDKNTKAKVTLLDGYNIIRADEKLTALMERNMAMSRGELDKIAAQYSKLTKSWCVVVYDAYKAEKRGDTRESHGELCFSVYSTTQEADTLLATMAGQAKEWGSQQVTIASNDLLVQNAAFDDDHIMVPIHSTSWLRYAREIIEQGSSHHAVQHISARGQPHGPRIPWIGKAKAQSSHHASHAVASGGAASAAGGVSPLHGDALHARLQRAVDGSLDEMDDPGFDDEDWDDLDADSEVCEADSGCENEDGSGCGPFAKTNAEGECVWQYNPYDVMDLPELLTPGELNLQAEAGNAVPRQHQASRPPMGSAAGLELQGSGNVVEEGVGLTGGLVRGSVAPATQVLAPGDDKAVGDAQAKRPAVSLESLLGKAGRTKLKSLLDDLDF